MNLQEQINLASSGATIRIPDNESCIGSFIVNKSVNIVGGVGSKIVSPAVSPTQPVAEPPIVIPPGTGPVSLQGLEITVAQGVTKIFDLIRFGTGDLDQNTLAKAPQGLTIDKCDIHGLPNAESQRGISANGANFKITNSKVWEIHGRGYDTQALCSWNGPGPFFMEDCYFEGAGENVMFGGSPPTIPDLIHSDIQVRRCRFFKPLSWRGVWSVKNLFELKNARRVVVEGCTFENNWTDAQAGRAIVFTPRPNDSGLAARIEDVIFQNNTIKNVGSGMLLLGMDQPPAPQDVRLKRVKILNNLWLNVNGPEFASNGAWLTIINGTEDVTAEHNTVIQTGSIVLADYAPNARFICRYNISRHNEYGVFGSGQGTGKVSLDFYFPNSVFTENVIAQEVGAPSGVEMKYPAGNRFPATLSEAIGSDYKPTQTYAGLGCDIDALNAAQGGTAAPIPLPAPAPAPTPVPTTPAVESPNNTRIPTATQIVDSTGAIWTFTTNGIILRNAQGTGGQGSILLYCNRIVYAFGTDSQWYKWGNGWTAVGVVDPCASVTPTPTPVPPAPTPQPAPQIRKLAQPTSESKWNTLLAQQKSEGYMLTKFLTGSWVQFEKF